MKTAVLEMRNNSIIWLRIMHLAHLHELHIYIHINVYEEKISYQVDKNKFVSFPYILYRFMVE